MYYGREIRLNYSKIRWVLAKRIHKDTEPSIENNASEYLLNVLGDVTGDVLMQGFTGSR